LSIDLARGTEWIGFNTPKYGATVLYLQLEVAQHRFQQRVRIMVGEDPRTIQPLRLWTEHFLKLDSKEGLEVLKAEVDMVGPRVLIIDPLYKIMSGNMLSAYEVSKFTDGLDRLLSDHKGLSVILVTHSRKAARDSDPADWGSDELMGSVLLGGWADSVIQIQRPEYDKLRVKFDALRHAREEMKAIDLVVDFRSLTFNHLIRI